jgi:DNA-binding transcriptional MerR regulator/methanogenic corrinoid protein MtbC1
MSEALHPIQLVAERTGLSPHVIRIWERRYGAVTPERTESNRRLYSDENIERFQLLRQLTGAGHAIGAIAALPTERLQRLLGDAEREVEKLPARQAVEPAGNSWVVRALSAVERMDGPGLGVLLKEGSVALGAQGVLERLVAPLAHELGEQWRAGLLTAAHEHFATAVLRTFLGQAARPFAASETAPVLVVATPTGQLHELGALLASASAANLGWRVIYLGPSLGVAEIAGAVRQNQARALALSIVYPEDDSHLPGELARLRDLLPETAIIAGGRAAEAYRKGLGEIGAHFAPDLKELGVFLDRLRRGGVG